MLGIKQIVIFRSLDMHKLLPLALAVLIHAPVMAQTTPQAITGPTEIGTTTMAAGQYLVTDKTSGKVYDLMVTVKGDMILSPAAGAAVATSAAAAAAVAPVAPAAVAPASVAPASAPASAINSLLNQGMQRGMNELTKRGATNQIKNLVK